MDLKKILLQEQNDYLTVDKNNLTLSVGRYLPLYYNGRVSDEIFPNTIFKPTKNGNLVTKTDVLIKQNNTKLNKTVYYLCKSNKIKIDDKIYTLLEKDQPKFKGLCPLIAAKSGVETQKQQEQEKLDKAKKCGHNSWVEYKKSGWKCDVNKKIIPGGGNVNTTDIIKKTQELLGMQPTGQYTEDQILTIFNKLGGKIPTMTESLNEELKRIKTVMKFLMNEQAVAPQPLPTGPEVGPKPFNQLQPIQQQSGTLQGGDALNKVITNKEKSPSLTGLQNLLNGQYGQNLTPDGLIGPKTATALYNVVKNLNPTV